MLFQHSSAIFRLKKEQQKEAIYSFLMRHENPHPHDTSEHVKNTVSTE